METLRVNISFRPLRIAWAIKSTDKEAFRRVVRYSHALWGGRFNPIVFADRPDEAKDVIELFRADIVLPVGDAEEVRNFPSRFPHLINPFHSDDPFHHSPGQRAYVQVLDIHNALVHRHDTSEWKRFSEEGIRRFTWEDNDPLADMFLTQLGAYPRKEDIGTDYLLLLGQAANVVEVPLAAGGKIHTDAVGFPTLASVGRFGLDHHYSIRRGWDHAGFFVGDAERLDDLVTFWNLRAADIWLYFVDPNHLERFEFLVPKAEAAISGALAHLDSFRQKLAVWSRAENFPAAGEVVPSAKFHCGIDSEFIWKGGAVVPPMMTLGDASSLGIIGTHRGVPNVSFSLGDKPFAADSWFHSQHLVASVDMLGGLHSDEVHTFRLPYVPELNEFYSRQVHFDYSKLRVEPGHIGVVIDATEHNLGLSALPVPALVERVMDLAGFSAKPSSAGLIARQVISRLGGVDGARAFKIPGVRRLLKTHGPTSSFTKRGALQLIGQTPSDNPNAKFSDHEDLFIEQRPIHTKLTPLAVFKYLVEKGLFRMGVDLTCPSCNLSSWVPLDVLKQSNRCELCGADHDATRQLIDGEYAYRRSGLLGIQKDVQGAIPVVLTLQQFSVNLPTGPRDLIYVPSYDLIPKGGQSPQPFEVDFIVLLPQPYPKKTAVLIGECKDAGDVIDAKDIEGLRRVADALPAERFEPYIVLARLSPFTSDEIALAKGLNGPYQQRVIMLTERELEPYHLYKRTKLEFDIDEYASSPEDMARVTAKIYFSAAAAVPAEEPPAQPEGQTIPTGNASTSSESG